MMIYLTPNMTGVPLNPASQSGLKVHIENGVPCTPSMQSYIFYLACMHLCAPCDNLWYSLTAVVTSASTFVSALPVFLLPYL